jgi:hypothetical protein
MYKYVWFAAVTAATCWAGVCSGAVAVSEPHAPTSTASASETTKRPEPKLRPY